MANVVDMAPVIGGSAPAVEAASAGTAAPVYARPRRAADALRRPDPWDVARTGLGAAAGVGLLLVVAGAFLYAPAERVQGDVQRIFYIHVPMAIGAYLAFFVVFAASVAYLWKRRPIYDLVARSSAEVGVLFTTLVLLTGSIWARPIWGTWWSWDARLTTTLVLWLIYVAYLMVRSYAGDPAQGARYAAVVGIVGFTDVPLVHQSVVWWRTLHPGPTVVQAGGSVGMPLPMLHVFLLSLAVFTLLYCYLLLEKVAIEEAKDRIALLRLERSG